MGEAEPLARFVYAQHEGQCYYSSLNQYFYEVDHRTNLWVANKKGDILYHCQDIFGSKDTREPRSHFEVAKGNLSSESYISLIRKTSNMKIIFQKSMGKIYAMKFVKTIVLPPYQIE